MANEVSEKELNEQTQQIQNKTGFGQNGSMSFGEYQKWLAEMNANNEMNDDQMKQLALSDARTKGFVSRGFTGDSVVKKMIGLNMMNNGIIDTNLMGYFLAK